MGGTQIVWHGELSDVCQSRRAHERTVGGPSTCGGVTLHDAPRARCCEELHANHAQRPWCKVPTSHAHAAAIHCHSPLQRQG